MYISTDMGAYAEWAISLISGTFKGVKNNTISATYISTLIMTPY